MKKNHKLLLLLMLISINSFAQINFQSHIITDVNSVTNGPNSVYATDIDGDGDLDILSASNHDDKIAWFENLDGLGNFSNLKIITTDTDFAISVFSADLDNDGDMDVLSGSLNDDKIAWYQNDGLGNFGNQIIISTNANSASSVFASDLDGDGYIDVLSTSSIDDKVAWYKNDGTGNFGNEQIISTNSVGASFVYAIDIDNDNDMDLLVASFIDNTIAWFENMDGLGSFGAKQIISNNTLIANSVIGSDIDNDGDIDVISGSSDSGVSWFENLDGLGNFGTQQIVSSNTESISVFTSDFDNDGDLDILSTSNNNNKLVWFENTDGLGNFNVENTITTNIQLATSTLAFDIDNDGNMDVISASVNDNKVAWYKNIDGNGIFGEQNNLVKGAFGASSVFAIDIDGDDDIDVLSSSQIDNKIAWYENTDGNGLFSSQQIISTNALSATSVFAIDIDNDNDIDVISASQNDDKISWYENLDSEGSFGNEQIVSTNADGASFVFAADLDGDNDNDILSSSRFDNKIAWYENIDGNGNFGEEQIITTEAFGAKSLYVKDLDNDGDLDVLSASLNDNKIAWYENTNGLGNFGQQQVITTLTDNAYSVFAIDIDNDTNIDVLSASQGNDTIAWYKNLDGQGTFGTQEIITSNAASAYSVFSCDLDNDGDQDILSASWSDSKIAWYENSDGLGNFNEQQIISIDANGANSVFAIDIDGDGDKDVLSSSYNDSKIVWYENLNTLTINDNVLNDLVIYPNPTNKFLEFNSKTKIIKIEIYDNIGQIVLINPLSTKIDISNLTQGIYFVKVEYINRSFDFKKIILKK